MIHCGEKVTKAPRYLFWPRNYEMITLDKVNISYAWMNFCVALPLLPHLVMALNLTLLSCRDPISIPKSRDGEVSGLIPRDIDATLAEIVPYAPRIGRCGVSPANEPSHER